MTTISLYALQAGLGLMILAAGTAKILGLDAMEQAFALLGLGWPACVVVGALEVTAGLCLLLPRAGVMGAALLAALMSFAVGGTIGQAASEEGLTGVPMTVSQTVQPSLCMGQCRPAHTIGAKRSWDI
jgi:uncharacterized membrane protein YphA (DoxX/SURF4 family)